MRLPGRTSGRSHVWAAAAAGWCVNWPQHSAGWCHSVGGKCCGEQGRHVCQRENISTGRSPGAALERGHTQSAAACSFLRRSTVLNRAAPGQMCMRTGLCDMSPCGHKSHLCCMLVVCVAWRIVTSWACVCSHLQRSQGVWNKDVPC